MYKVKVSSHHPKTNQSSQQLQITSGEVGFIRCLGNQFSSCFCRFSTMVISKFYLSSLSYGRHFPFPAFQFWKEVTLYILLYTILVTDYLNIIFYIYLKYILSIWALFISDAILIIWLNEEIRSQIYCFDWLEVRFTVLIGWCFKVRLHSGHQNSYSGNSVIY